MDAELTEELRLKLTASLEAIEDRVVLETDLVIDRSKAVWLRMTFREVVKVAKLAMREVLRLQRHIKALDEASEQRRRADMAKPRDAEVGRTDAISEPLPILVVQSEHTDED